jgi:hypothetical protein
MSNNSRFKYPLWFRWAAVVVSLGMFADYLRLVLTTDNSLGRLIVLAVWCVICFHWISALISYYRHRGSKSPVAADEANLPA